LNDATEKGYLTPAMYEWDVALCEQNSASFDAFMTSAAPAYAHLFKPSTMRSRPETGTKHHGEIAQAICSQLGIKPSDLVD
jgi:Mu-like prophage I protein